MTDFAELLYRTLPGIYRQKDDKGELVGFLGIMASPLAETEDSIGQLQQDLFLSTCRDPFIALVGSLLGVSVDATLPAGVQRTEVEQALAFYRSKGLRLPIREYAQSITGFATTTVDFSETVSLVPFIESMNPVVRRRRRIIGEASPAGNGRFFFDPGLALTPLYDARLGRPMTRLDLVNRPSELVGKDAGFSLFDHGVEVFTKMQPPRTMVPADLTDFAAPKTPGGAALVLVAGDVAVDPELGRFLFATPLPLAGNLTASYSHLVPASIPAQTVDVRDSSKMKLFGRSDDLTPRTLDLRAPRSTRDRIGRSHFDNHGIFLTLGRVFANRRPNQLGPSAPARLTFDDRPLALGDLVGNALQLTDGLDGTALTRAKLAAAPADYAGTWRGFDIRSLGVSLFDPAFSPAVTLVSADLSTLASPKTPGGAALVLTPTTVAVDPQLGRVLLNLAGLGLAVETLRVGYLLAPATRALGATPMLLAPAAPGVYSFDPTGAFTPLRDAFDGTPLSVKLRLGALLSAFHGTDRGYRIYLNGSDVSAALTPALVSLDDPSFVPAAGTLALDPDRGFFSVPAGFIAAGSVLTVDFTFEDLTAEQRIIDSLAQRLPRTLPAGVVPVIVDTRQTPVDPAVLS